MIVFSQKYFTGSIDKNHSHQQFKQHGKSKQ